MGLFDDEFGLFGDELPLLEEDERRSTLGERRLAEGEEIVIDDIEPEETRGARRPFARRPLAPAAAPPTRFVRDRRRFAPQAEVSRDRAVELLRFLATGLVSHPEAIRVEAHENPRQGLVLDLEVAAPDLGKVIGRGGRLAQALRTVVRAAVEGRVAIEIVDVAVPGEESSPVEAPIVQDEIAERALAVGDVSEQTASLPVASAEDAPKRPRTRRPRRSSTTA